MKYQDSSINMTFTDEELSLLLKRSLLGDQHAKHLIYVSFLPQVGKIVNLFPEKMRVELLERGRLSLIKAINSFRCESNLNFHHTFKYYISESIISFLKTHYDISSINNIKIGYPLKNIMICIDEYNYINDINVSKNIKRNLKKIEYLILQSQLNLPKIKQKRL